MTLSLDTNVFVDLLRGIRGSVRDHFVAAQKSGQPLRASLIVAHELYFGAELHINREKTRRQVRDILAQVVIEPLDIDDMQAAARIRASLRQAGSSIGFYDALIAGQAIARGWRVVTGNAREFGRVPGLEVLDWTKTDTGPSNKKDISDGL